MRINSDKNLDKKRKTASPVPKQEPVVACLKSASAGGGFSV